MIQRLRKDARNARKGTYVTEEVEIVPQGKSHTSFKVDPFTMETGKSMVAQLGENYSCPVCIQNDKGCEFGWCADHPKDRKYHMTLSHAHFDHVYSPISQFEVDDTVCIDNLNYTILAFHEQLHVVLSCEGEISWVPANQRVSTLIPKGVPFEKLHKGCLFTLTPEKDLCYENLFLKIDATTIARLCDAMSIQTKVPPMVYLVNVTVGQ